MMQVFYSEDDDQIPYGIEEQPVGHKDTDTRSVDQISLIKPFPVIFGDPDECLGIGA